jgi:hypothetical protein
MGAGIGSWLRKSLYVALLWRMLLGVAVVGAAVMLRPRWWVVVAAGLVAALWVA